MVSTTKTNKPFNPRGNDQSPLAYNRAKLFSGKALSFDGVNDSVETSAVPLPSAGAISFYYQADATGGEIAECGGSTDDFRIIINSLCGFYTGAEYRISTSGLWPIDDKFHFVVFTWGDFGTKFYLNGQFVKENTNRPADFSSVPTTLYIGVRDGSSNFFDGQLSGFKIFNTALTAAQVADLYNNPEKVVPTGVDNTALKLWLPMMEGAGTTAINGADPLGSDIVTNGDFSNGSTGWTLGNCWTISNEKMVSDGTSNAWSFQNNLFTSGKKYKVEFEVSGYSSGSLNVKVGATSGADDLTNITANGTYNIETEADGVYLLFKPTTFVGAIDNVTAKEINVADINGATWTHGIGAPVAQTSVIDWNKNTLDKTNEVLIPQGLTSGRDLLGNLFENVRKQGALNLDGNSWAEVHDNGSLDFGTGSFTLEAWVRVKYVAQGSAYNAVMTLGGDVAQKTGLVLVSNLEPRFIYNGNTSSIAASTLGNWIHMMGVYNETNATFYVNGSQVDQDARTAVNITNDLVKYIGRDTEGNRYYSDQIAQPRIYNRALTAEEVQRSYDSGKNIFTNS